MTTIVEARTTVSRIRKRPNTKDKWIKEEFGDQPFKRLEIPDFIDMYNHLMNSVDRADQIRTNRRNYRTWKPLWNYLFQTTIRNAVLIWIDQGYSTKKKGGNLNFRKKFATQLMTYSSSSKYTSPIDGFGFVRIFKIMLLQERMPVMEYVQFPLRLQRNARLVWLKVVRHRQVGKE